MRVAPDENYKTGNAMEKITVESLCIGNTIPFPAQQAEMMAYALDEAGFIGPETRINGQPAREILQRFFAKRERFRENSRLGQLMVNEFGVTCEQLVQALSYHELNKVPLGEAFVQLKICEAHVVEEALSRQVSLRANLR